MIWITESKLFKGSKYQDKILAAIDNPINKPLVKQLRSYIDSKYIDDLLSEKESDEFENNEVDQQNTEESFDESREESKSTVNPEPEMHRSSPKSSPSLNSEKPESEEFEGKEEDSSEEKNSEGVKESIHIPLKDKVIASSYVTMEDVSQAIKFIPGTLNLTEGTCGVTYVTIKGTPASEVWIYYNSDIDINKVLMKLNSTLIEAGYTFLSFNRVSRDENAVVFTINWATTYYQQPSFEVKENES